MISIQLLEGKKLYFASDFHLGLGKEFETEKKVLEWLSGIEKDVQALFLVGDLFDFWFEYKNVVPRGFVRFLGKLAEFSDKGISIYIFGGNHDLWYKDYLKDEINAQIFLSPQSFLVESENQKHRFYIGHGDGLGPGDFVYKFVRKVFISPISQFLFYWIHPAIGISLAKGWSGQSRLANLKSKKKEKFSSKEQEWLWQYACQINENTPYDFFIFGHRHIPLDLPVGKESRYINLGEWVFEPHFARYDGDSLILEQPKLSH